MICEKTLNEYFDEFIRIGMERQRLRLEMEKLAEEERVAKYRAVDYINKEDYRAG